MILYIYYKYMHCFLNTGEISRRKELVVYLLLLLWHWAASLLMPHSLCRVSTFLMIFVLTGLYGGSLQRKLALTLFLYGTIFFCELLAEWIPTFWKLDKGTDMFYMTETISMLILMYLCELLAELAKRYVQQRRIGLVRSEGVQRQLEGYSNQLAVLKGTEEKVRGLQHDLKHHLNELMLLAERDEASEIKNYIRHMDSFMTNEGEHAASGNTDIDSLLNLMLEAAKRELRDVTCKVCIPDVLDIEPFDMNVILGNLIDNAVLAAKQTQEQSLHIKISYRMGMLLIAVENSYAGSLKKEGERYLSTKEDSAGHGRGIENVKRIVEKYDGHMQINHENNRFRVKIFLYTAAG